MEDTIVDIPFGCRYHTGVQQAVGKLQQQGTISVTCTKAEGDIRAKGTAERNFDLDAIGPSE